jgi:hypothetical protein
LGQRKNCPLRQVPLKRGSNDMKSSMTGKEKDGLLRKVTA